MRRALLAAVLCAIAVAACGLPATARAQNPQSDSGVGASSGGALFDDGCVSCHGPDARGVPGQGPSLRGAGAAAIDFYLSTGRMPLADPHVEPPRTEPVYGAAERRAIVAYLTGLQPGGDPIPAVHPERGDVARGRRLFADTCSGCHQIVGKGGVDPEIIAPALDDATSVQIAEAIRVGPYLMPRFGEKLLDTHDVDSIARYVTQVVQHPENRGGWGIGNVGPIPEGLVAWLLAGGVLLFVARLIGKRAR
ncbi:MAG: ubiquinol-cytochrome c reductase cytochrome c subunit [Solirubrobacteraceae bacterium]|nr:ubiquinol-cytochrome c reductase cytochrome c subunit [Solirubrobacteraceae bacterium]